MRYGLILTFCVSFAACAVDTGPSPDVGASAEALSYADNCVAKAFVTTDNGAFVVGKVVGNGTNVRGHWLHLGEPIAAPATCSDDDDDGDDHDGDDDHGDDDDRADGDHGHGHGHGHGRWDDDDDEHGSCDDDDDDDHGSCDDDDDDDEHEGDDDDDECEHGGAPTRHVVVGHPTSLLCRPNGGFLAHVEGTASFDGAPGYTFALQLDDLSSHGLPNQYVLVVFDSTGAVVYSDPFDQVATGSSSVVVTGPPSLPTP